MPEITKIVRHELGLHARPAALFVQAAMKFESDITISRNDQEANAKSILTVLTLGICQGAEVVICAHGDDADEALIALSGLIESNFVEDR